MAPGSFPIRAPITPDDDSLDFESKADNVYSDTSSSVDNGSGSGSGSEYGSGEEFESASEKLFAGDPDEENVEDSGFFGKNQIFRPFVGNPYEESLGNSVVNEESEFDPAVHSGSPNLDVGMPIAQLSMDDDEFEELIFDEPVLSGEEEDKKFAGIVLERLDSAPRVKVSDVEEDKEFELLLQKDLVAKEKEDNFEPLVEQKEDNFEEILEVKVVGDSGLVELFKDDDGAVLSEAQIESLVEIKEGDSFSAGVAGESAEERAQYENLEQKEQIVEAGSFNGDAHESDSFNGDTHEIELNQEDNIVSEPPEAEKAESLNAERIIAIDRIVAHEIEGEIEVLEADRLEDSTEKEIQIVDSVVNASLLELLEADKLEDSGPSNANSFGIKDEVTIDSGEIEVQKDLFSDEDTQALIENEPNEFHDHLQRIDGEIVPDSDVEMKIIKDQTEEESFDPDKDVVSNNLTEEEKNLVEKIHHIRVKFLRLVHRLGLAPEDSIVAQVLYRLVLAAGRHFSEESSLESAKREALQLEAMSNEELDFCLNMLVIGKTGVGKSATVNSIFGEKKAMINAFEPATNKVKEVFGIVNGVKIRVLDTPGLRSSVKEEAKNKKILASIKKITKKFPPDVVLYVDRLDCQSIDLPLLASVTNFLTGSIWRNAIVTLTHAAAAPPDGPYGSPLSFEIFVARRSHVLQQAISQAIGDIRLMIPSMMQPVSLVENHPAGLKNENGEIILPNGQSWRPQLLLLCYSLKILSETNAIIKPQNLFDEKKPFGLQLRSFPLPHLVSSLLQSRPHLKLDGHDDVDFNMELLDLSDSDDEDEYYRLPPFKPLKKSQVNKLSKEQRNAYFEEYDYQVKLFHKKQLKEEAKRLKEIKKKSYMGEDVNLEDEEPATVPVSMPDFALPPSFDGDNPSYRYRMLEPVSQLLVRPVLDTQGWDHDIGYDGVSLETNLAIAGQFPGTFAVQITKDKKDFNIHLDSAICTKHGEAASTMAGFDIQNIGRQLVYMLKTETKFKKFKLNKTSAGMCITMSGKNMATGLKLEDQIKIGKRVALVGNAGAVRSKGETAYGSNFEVRLKSEDFPIEQDQSTFSLSLMKFRGDVGLMANLQSQFSISRDSKMAVRVGMNNKKSGQISIKTSSSELQVALIAVVPVLLSILRNVCSDSRH